jgi:hypothetical protein
MSRPCLPRGAELAIINAHLSTLKVPPQNTPMLEDAKDSLERIREGLAAKGESL